MVPRILAGNGARHTDIFGADLMDITAKEMRAFDIDINGVLSLFATYYLLEHIIAI